MKFLCVCVAVAATFGSICNAQDPGTTPFPPGLTSFSCHDRPPGYYADVETGCRTYHVCDGISQFTYVCPSRTLFQQSNRICDHSYRVNCRESPHFYQDEEGSLSHLLQGFEEEISSTFSSDENTEDYGQTDESIPATTTPFEIHEITETPTTLPTTTASTLTTATKAATQKPTTDLSAVNLKQDKTLQKFLRFRLKDFRSLFFIPEVDTNSIVRKPEREVVLPVEKNDLLTFKNPRGGRSSYSPCPTYCNAKFFVPGTCHPCIMIK